MNILDILSPKAIKVPLESSDKKGAIDELIDLMAAVGKRAQDYFATVPGSDLSNAELYRRSQLLELLGEVANSTGSQRSEGPI